MPETATDVIARIKRNERERAYCLEVLDLWAKAQGQGVEIETIDKWGFDPKLLSATDKRRANVYRCQTQADLFMARLPDGRYRPLFHNYVRHFDGTITPLNPMLKAPYEDG